MSDQLVIFLDVDGVLNCAHTKDRIPNNGCIGIDEDKCALFRAAVLRADAKIVLSSTWRLHSTCKSYLWKRLGDDIEQRCIGQTTDGARQLPNSSLYRAASREAEIQDWLTRNPDCKNFLILDDARIESAELKPRHIRTLWSHGLTEELATKIL